jgi:hypothetical protein
MEPDPLLLVREPPEQLDHMVVPQVHKDRRVGLPNKGCRLIDEWKKGVERMEVNV